jgi:hypothetical protein
MINFKRCSKIAEQIQSLVQYSPPRIRDTTRPDVLEYVKYRLKSIKTMSSGDTLRAAEQRSAILAVEELSLAERRKVQSPRQK